jgi:hypothetical protein
MTSSLYVKRPLLHEMDQQDYQAWNWSFCEAGGKLRSASQE